MLSSLEACLFICVIFGLHAVLFCCLPSWKWIFKQCSPISLWDYGNVFCIVYSFNQEKLSNWIQVFVEICVRIWFLYFNSVVRHLCPCLFLFHLYYDMMIVSNLLYTQQTVSIVWDWIMLCCWKIMASIRILVDECMGLRARVSFLC